VTFFAAFTGYALSPEKPQDIFLILRDAAFLFMLFSVALWGGTNAFNSAQDGDEGPLTLLPNPPKVPKHLSAFGLSLMVTAILLATIVSMRLTAFVAFGVALSIFYSWKNPWTRRGKDVPMVDMLMNAFGFGFCSILCGYLLTPASIEVGVLVVGVGFTFAYLGGMPTSQMFQLKENGNERNYTAVVGAKNVLRLGALFFAVHLLFVGFGFADGVTLKQHPWLLVCWTGWLLLVAVSAIHSYWWSASPYTNAYNRMNRQMVMMMSSQILWTVYAWGVSRIV